MSLSVFPGSQDTFKTIPTPTTTPTSLSDASDDTLSVRLQQHSDAINAIENWLLTTGVTEQTGVVKMFAGSVAPTGYVLCDGTAYSRTGSTANLFAVCGTNYGSGDGSTTFNVPDMRGRASIGVGSATAQTSARTLASTVGEETHLLLSAELASHTHTQNPHTHTASDSGHIHTDSGHQHQTNFQTSAFGTGAAGNTLVGGGSAIGALSTVNSAVITTGFAIIGVSSTTPTINATAAGVAHNNIQPSLALNFIIKT